MANLNQVEVQRKRMHIGIGVGWLRQFITERGNKGFIEQGDKPLSKAQALAYLDELTAKGIEVITNCDNQDAKGYCQGHLIGEG